MVQATCCQDLPAEDLTTNIGVYLDPERIRWPDLDRNKSIDI